MILLAARRLTSMITIWIVVTAILVVLLEVILRQAGFGYDTRFLIQETIDGKQYYVNNHRFSWKFFPKSLARLPASMVVPMEKQSGVVRIVVIGESAAMGDPEPAFSFSRMLEVMLKERYPAKKFEVYNASITAINSHVITEIVEDCRVIQPDLFIAYMGNNEVIGPFGLSSVLSPFFSNYHVIQFKKWLAGTATGQWIRSFTIESKPHSEWRGLKMFSNQFVRSDDENLQSIYGHFEQNLAKISNAASACGAHVVFSTVVTNERDCPPFKSLSAVLNGDHGERWKTLWQNALIADSLGRGKDAVLLFRDLIKLDSGYAETYFRMARIMSERGERDEAERYFAKARDLDALRFRADSKINSILSSYAARNAADNVTLVDPRAALQETPGDDIFYEHVHLNHRGNYLIAAAFLPEVERIFALNATSDVPDLGACLVRLGKTTFDDQRITEANLSRLGALPFTLQYTNAIQRAELKEQLSKLRQVMNKDYFGQADSLYRRRIADDERDYHFRLNYLKFLNYFGRNEEAFAQAKALYNLVPHEYLSSVNMGVTSLFLRNYDDAEKWLKRAIDLNPYFSEAWRDLALVYKAQRRFKIAESAMLQARASKREVALMYHDAGLEFLKEGRVDSAVTYFDHGIRFDPTVVSLHQNRQVALKQRSRAPRAKTKASSSDEYNYANAMFKKGNYVEAINSYKKVIKVTPDFAKAHNNLGIAFIQTGRSGEALLEFEAAARLDPQYYEAHLNIGMVHFEHGRYREAIRPLTQAAALRPENEVYSLLARSHQQVGDSVNAKRYSELALGDLK